MIKDNLISIIIGIVICIYVILFPSDDIIKLRPISIDTLIICATLAITIIIPFLASLNSKIIKEDNKQSTLKNSKSFLFILCLDLIILVLIDSIKAYPLDYDLECKITTFLNAVFFICYLISIIFLIALLYDLVKFIDNFQGENNTEQTQSKNGTKVLQQKNIHIHIHIHKE